jgi:hypothetical protein
MRWSTGGWQEFAGHEACQAFALPARICRQGLPLVLRLVIFPPVESNNWVLNLSLGILRQALASREATTCLCMSQGIRVPMFYTPTVVLPMELMYGSPRVLAYDEVEQEKL